MDYSKMTDDELINIYKTDKQESQKAMETIVNRYKPVVNSRATKFFAIGAEQNDIVQEGMMALVSAVRNYEKGNNASFKTFANLCIERRLITFIKNANSQKQMPLNTAISYNVPVENPSISSGNELIDALNLGYNPYEELENKELYKKVTNQLYKKLSKHEEEVLNEYLKGKSYAQIANTLNCDSKSVDTALTRIRKKGNVILKEIKNN